MLSGKHKNDSNNLCTIYWVFQNHTIHLIETLEGWVHTIPVHQLMSCEVKSCMFVRNISTIRGCLNFKMSLLESIIHNNASYNEKVHPLLSSHIKIHLHICLELLLVNVSCSAYFSPDSDEMTCNVMDRVKYITNTQLFASQDINRWTGVVWCGLLMDYCDVLSAVWTLILTAPIHYRWSIGEQVM